MTGLPPEREGPPDSNGRPFKRKLFHRSAPITHSSFVSPDQLIPRPMTFAERVECHRVWRRAVSRGDRYPAEIGVIVIEGGR